MKQKNDRAVCRPGFAIKDIETIDLDGFVKDALLDIEKHFGVRRLLIVRKDVNDAIDLLQRNTNQIGLVLTDLVMPELGGLALVEKMRQINPEIKVLYTSGYSDEVIVRHGHLDEGMPFIEKPFGAGDLLRKVRQVLDLG